MKRLLLMTVVSLMGMSAHAISDQACAQNGISAAEAAGYTNLTLSSLEKITGDGRSQIHGYRIWLTSAGHRGYVVANADSFCRVFDVYTHW